MNKKILAGAVALVFLIVLGGGALYIKSNLTRQEENALTDQQEEKLSQYSDSAGFSFKYPSSVLVESSDTSDANTYSDLKISASDVSGEIKVKVEDKQSLSSDEDSNKALSSSPDAKEIVLAGIKGQEIKVDNGINSKFLDKDILFTIEVDFGEEKEFWQKVYNTMVSTFEFSNPSDSQDSTQTDNSQTEEEVIFEGEEIIE